MLADEEMARAVGAINRQIHRLAAVINGPTIEHGATVTAEPAEVTPDPGRSMHMDPVAITIRKHEGATYLFAVRMEDKPAKATYQLKGLSGKATVEVLVGQGHASPIVWGDRVFICTAHWPETVRKREEVIPEHHVLCYSADDRRPSGLLCIRIALDRGRLHLPAPHTRRVEMLERERRPASVRPAARRHLDDLVGMKNVFCIRT